MTGAQASYLTTLCEEAKRTPPSAHLTKAKALKLIDEVKAQLGRSPLPNAHEIRRSMPLCEAGWTSLIALTSVSRHWPGSSVPTSVDGFFRSAPIAVRTLRNAFVLDLRQPRQCCCNVGTFDQPEGVVPTHHYGIESRLFWADIGSLLPGKRRRSAGKAAAAHMPVRNVYLWALCADVNRNALTASNV